MSWLSDLIDRIFRRRPGPTPWPPRPYPAPVPPGPIPIPPLPVPTPGVPPDAGSAEFVRWLNSVRASNFEGPLAWDQTLADEARKNDILIGQNGLGHWYVPPGEYQVAASGFRSAIDAGNAWLGDKPHRDILLSTHVTRCGIAGDGTNWTANLR